MKKEFNIIKTEVKRFAKDVKHNGLTKASTTRLINTFPIVEDAKRFLENPTYNNGFRHHFDNSMSEERDKVAKETFGLNGDGLCFPVSIANAITALEGIPFNQSFDSVLSLFFKYTPDKLFEYDKNLPENERMNFQFVEDAHLFTSNDGGFDPYLFFRNPDKATKYFNKILKENNFNIRMNYFDLADFLHDMHGKNISYASRIFIDRIEEYFQTGKVLIPGMTTFVGPKLSGHAFAIIGTGRSNLVSKGLVIADQRIEKPVIWDPETSLKFMAHFVVPDVNGVKGHYIRREKDPIIVIEREN